MRSNLFLLAKFGQKVKSRNEVISRVFNGQSIMKNTIITIFIHLVQVNSQNYKGMIKLCYFIFSLIQIG
jgi:hypothetical protein